MHFLTLPFLGLAALAAADASSFTESFCLTVEGKSSVASVPRTTIGKTKSVTVTIKSTSSQTSTVTPSPVTTTTTIYTTKTSTVTAPINTDTFSATTTLYTTSTSTVVIAGGSTTVTSTSTSTQQDTTTISASAGFTPIQSQIKSQDFTTWTARPAKRDARLEQNVNKRAPASPSASTSLYPSKVTCLAFVQVLSTSTSVISATKVKTTTLKPVTTTKTSTSTIYTTKTTTAKSASTTIVSTFTSSISTATTTTSTSTSTIVESTTVVGPTVSSYAVCNNPGNFLHKIQGVPIASLLTNYSPALTITRASDINDELSCCNACQMAGDQLCQISSWDTTHGCVFVAREDGTCQAGKFIVRFTTQFGGSDYTLMNGNCATWDYDFGDSYGPYAGCEPGTGVGCPCGPGTDTDC